MNEIKNNIPPIFILGNRRSGTTMLRLMLTNHSSIGIPPEGGFVIRLGWKYDQKIFRSEDLIDHFLDDLYQSQNIQDWEIQKPDLRKWLVKIIPSSFPRVIEEIYLAYNDYKFSGVKTRWGDKTTWYINYLDQIQRYFPQALFIHIIRDCRAVVNSYKGVTHLSDNVKESTLDWIWSIRTISTFGSKLDKGQYLEIRYEDLVEDAERELKSICDFIDEDFEAGMLDYWKANREKQLEPERHLEWKHLTLEEVTSERVSAWKSSLNSDEIFRIEALAYRELEKYGYNLTSESISRFDQIRYSIIRNFRLLFRSLIRMLREMKYRVLPKTQSF